MTSRATVVFGMALAVMLASCARSVRVASEPAAKEVAPVCLAVLEPEVLADLPEADRKALAGAIDTLLTESLAGRKEFVLVDRQALDKVLAEKAAAAAGIAKVSVADVAEPLRPFWAAGVLLCCTIVQDDGGNLVAHVEAIAAQSGQRLADLFERGVWKKGEWAGTAPLEKALGPFWADLRIGIARNSGLPLVEIADGQLVSELTRSQWMVGDLADALRAETAGDAHCVLLIPRQAASTKEERLLRLIGLSVRKAGDAMAELAPAPYARLTFQLEEQVAESLPLDRSPLTLTLTWSAGDKQPEQWSTGGTAGEWDAIRARAAVWVAERRVTLASPISRSNENIERKMAAEELALARHWEGVRFSSEALERQRRYRLCAHALRASHLDPTNEQAAYLVVLHIDSLYAIHGRDDTRECQDRIIAECQRYLDRFGRVAAAGRREEIRDRMASAAFQCEPKVAVRRGLAFLQGRMWTSTTTPRSTCRFGSIAKCERLPPKPPPPRTRAISGPPCGCFAWT